MQLFKTPNIPFLKYKVFALILTAAIVLAGVLNWSVFHGLKPGVDFGEGVLLRVKFKQTTDVGDIRRLLKEVGLAGSTIQETGKGGRDFQIRCVESKDARANISEEAQLESHARLADKIIASLHNDEDRAGASRGLKDLNTIDINSLTSLFEASFPGTGAEMAQKVIDLRNKNGILTGFGELEGLGLKASAVDMLRDKAHFGQLSVLSRETVGPQVGKDLRHRAFMAIIWSLIGMLVYIAIRFKLEYGVAAIFTLAQDVLITLTIYSFTTREINLTIIAGLLTIVGFSINDTIVIFDRIRENQKLFRKASLEDMMNLSLNQTLGRTLITSGTVLLTVLALFLFGGEVINDFAFLMLIGTIEGIYSTIFMSCPVVLFWQKVFPKKAR